MVINASNLHGGGAVGVAANFLDAIPSIWETEDLRWIGNLKIVVSAEVEHEMRHREPLRGLTDVSVVRANNGVWCRRFVPTAPSSEDLRFSFFGPEYALQKAKIEVVGFADASILPTRLAQDFSTTMNASGARSVKLRLRNSLKVQLLKKRYDAYVVQTDAMARALHQMVGGKPVALVPNVVSSVFRDPVELRELDLPPRQNREIRLCYPARAYPHKNHSYLLKVSEAFTKQYSVPLRFVVTLRQPEMARTALGKSDAIINVGEIDLRQCRYLYSETDGLFFPSLNETFSSSPIEAMLMRKPVIALPLPFNRGLLRNHCWYVPVGKPMETARAIADLFMSGKSIEQELSRNYDFARSFGDGITQAQSYFRFLRTLGSPGGEIGPEHLGNT